MKDVDLDVERFFKDMESIMNPQDDDEEEEDEGEEGSSDMDFGKFFFLCLFVFQSVFGTASFEGLGGGVFRRRFGGR